MGTFCFLAPYVALSPTVAQPSLVPSLGGPSRSLSNQNCSPIHLAQKNHIMGGAFGAETAPIPFLPGVSQTPTPMTSLGAPHCPRLLQSLRHLTSSSHVAHFLILAIDHSQSTHSPRLLPLTTHIFVAQQCHCLLSRLSPPVTRSVDKRMPLFHILQRSVERRPAPSSSRRLIPRLESARYLRHLLARDPMALHTVFSEVTSVPPNRARLHPHKLFDVTK